jgi:energy-converting hydrogenase Eha subunit B
MLLRGLPHLAKNMKRHCNKGKNKKALVESEHEPDLFMISELYPLPEKAADGSIMLQCTMQGGPRARMPVYTGEPSCPPAAATDQASQMNRALLVEEGGFAEIGEVPITNGSTANLAFAGGLRFPTAAAPLPQVQVITGLKAEQSIMTMPIPMNNAFALQHPMLQLLKLHQPDGLGFVCANSSQFVAGYAAAMAQGLQYFNAMLQSNIQAFHSRS